MSSRSSMELLKLPYGMFRTVVLLAVQLGSVVSSNRFEDALVT